MRATAVNRLGARLVGIGTTQAGRLSFTLAAAMGALCGILIAPLTTIYYESGFLVGLKGFVGAIVGGLIIGATEKLAEVYIGPYVGGGIENWFPYVLAMVFLLVRPEGLFGEKRIERV